MSYQEDFDIAQRYDLLCRASQSHVEQDGQRLQLAADLDVLDKIINHDLPELARSGSPDHFADILKSLNLELEHFREFCEFPDLAQKVVVGVGGAFSAGKSSLINTLLGKKRLVVEIDPTTSLPTYLLYGEQEQITALNLFRRRVILSQDEFASLTHEEKIKYGSQIAGLLRSAFVSDPDFAWKNIALLDTPGYSKPDSEQWSERTDESVARSQLNLSNFIIWVVSATQGTISEDDLKFLATLNADIPKLIVVSRADAKTPEDIAKIVALIKQTTAERGVNVLDVVPVSARKKNDYPVQPVVSFLEKWDEQKKGLSFAQNFKWQFLEYARFIDVEQRLAHLKLNRLNRILALSDIIEIESDTEELQQSAQADLQQWEDIRQKIDKIYMRFISDFRKINSINFSITNLGEETMSLNKENLNSNASKNHHIIQNLVDVIDQDDTLDELSKGKVLANLRKLRETKVNVLVTGATGSGKSSTINALFNTEKAKVGTGVDPETMDIAKYELENIVLFDSPGLGDGKEADIRHSKNITNKLTELDKDGNPVIDLVLVILDGGSRDLGTSFELINHVIIPSLGKDTSRLLIAINQADMAMKGRFWDSDNNKPEPKLVEFLNDKVASTQRRIFEATGVKVQPVYYAAGYKDDSGEQLPYNLSKLLAFILRHTKEEKRAIFIPDINPEEKLWAHDENLKKHQQEIKESFLDSLIKNASKGVEHVIDTVSSVVTGAARVVGNVVSGVASAARSFGSWVSSWF